MLYTSEHTLHLHFAALRQMQEDVLDITVDELMGLRELHFYGRATIFGILELQNGEVNRLI